jgi:hypothetical protein
MIMHRLDAMTLEEECNADPTKTDHELCNYAGPQLWYF